LFRGGSSVSFSPRSLCLALLLAEERLGGCQRRGRSR